MAAEYLQNKWDMPFVSLAPFGLLETKAFLVELQEALQTVQKEKRTDFDQAINFDDYITIQSQSISQLAWFSRSIDCQNLTGKKAVVFGDSTHAVGMTKVLTREMGVDVVCAGTYSKHDSDWFHGQVHNLVDEILVTDDHSQVREMITRLEPAAIFGTQMERHIGKALGIPCGVISAPVHIQNFPLGYRPFLGYEGSNNIADLVYNTYTLGMEDHLLEVFGGHDLETTEQQTADLKINDEFEWASDAYSELQTIPGFVRGKVKRNTEKFAKTEGFNIITREVLYKAKEAATA
jgi:light-independent protochlorophyllide reductase subunit B